MGLQIYWNSNLLNDKMNGLRNTANMNMVHAENVTFCLILFSNFSWNNFFLKFPTVNVKVKPRSVLNFILSLLILDVQNLTSLLWLKTLHIKWSNCFRKFLLWMLNLSQDQFLILDCHSFSSSPWLQHCINYDEQFPYLALRVLQSCLPTSANPFMIAIFSNG